ncbi:hypothetical protein [Desulfosporosinus sp. Sb-LF]|uniref:hypothetical protein n=1 Tax=Desulfosporosinus sp. Sb-LF TaxID=2560027 RepID=UPI00107EEF07|nr:hypothetical protein [Desulfosporosinus sp. Sb-LF]TGE34348.1 hypothetical protein E4K68_01215 [Desulfosporosinus sp. Sb-LF]
MDYEEIIRGSGLEKKALKVVRRGCLFLVIAFVVLLACLIILAFNYHAQIYGGFMSIINFIFGDSPNNVIRGYLKQFADSFIKNMFN